MNNKISNENENYLEELTPLIDNGEKEFISSFPEIEFQRIPVGDIYVWSAKGSRRKRPESHICVHATCIGKTIVDAYCNLQNQLNILARCLP